MRDPEVDRKHVLYWMACVMYEASDERLAIRTREPDSADRNWKSINPSQQDAWIELADLALARAEEKLDIDPIK